MKYLYKLAFATLVAVFVFSSLTSTAKEQPSKEVQIKTSAFSEMCKNKIESVLKDQKGVTDAYLSMEDKIVTITYNPELIQTEEIQKSIKDLGYDADLIKPIENKAQNNDQKPA